MWIYFELIFLKEPNYLSDSTMDVICEYGDYFFSPEGTYLRMYGGSKAPSLLPKYATDYVVHKEVVKQLFINGVGNFLFDMKNTTFSPLPFCIGSYKFTKVKGASEFVKALENFHFGEKSFHRNDSHGKVVEHCTVIGIHYEYIDQFDKYEEVYREADNMTELSKWFKKKGGTSSNTAEKKLQKQKEEALKLQQVEVERKQKEEDEK